MNEKEIYANALETYGEQSQVMMLFEEMAELQKEIVKNFRGKKNAENIAEEIADVQIMLEQMIMLFGINDAVSDYKIIKLKRLSNRITLEQGTC